jgi:hypothetical protein
MKAIDFLSTPEELLAAALVHGEALEARGFRLQVEPFDLAYPYTPVFIGKRQQTTVIVEVQSVLNFDNLEQWVRYGKACQTDTRVILGLPHGVEISGEQLDRLRSLGVGLRLIGGGKVYEVLPASDLALQIEPPNLPKKLRPILGEAYDKFDRGQWREGFEDACMVFEQEARAYLRTHVSRGRVTFRPTRRGGVPTLTQIDGMTMGQLAEAFARIQTPNQADTRIGQALKRLNRDRVTVAHYKGRGAARESRLRRNVGKNMFIVITGLKAIKGLRD